MHLMRHVLQANVLLTVMHALGFIDPIAYWLHQICTAYSVDIVFLLLDLNDRKIDSKLFQKNKDSEMYTLIWTITSHSVYRAWLVCFMLFIYLIFMPDLKKLASHFPCHYVPSHHPFRLKAGRHFISWLPFWFGSSPRSSVIAMLKMAYPSHSGLSYAINKQPTKEAFCWRGPGAEQSHFASVILFLLP